MSVAVHKRRLAQSRWDSAGAPRKKWQDFMYCRLPRVSRRLKTGRASIQYLYIFRNESVRTGRLGRIEARKAVAYLTVGLCTEEGRRIQRERKRERLAF